jgi:hypothetical protein
MRPARDIKGLVLRLNQQDFAAVENRARRSNDDSPARKNGSSLSILEMGDPRSGLRMQTGFRQRLQAQRRSGAYNRARQRHKAARPVRVILFGSQCVRCVQDGGQRGLDLRLGRRRGNRCNRCHGSGLRRHVAGRRRR